MNLIDSVDRCLRLSQPVLVDLHDVGKLAQEVLSGQDLPHRVADALVDELARELLTGWSDSWLLLERERWDQLRLHALEALAQQFQLAQQYLPALQTALSVIAIDRVRETAHRIVMEVHIAEGNVASAFKCYQEYRAFLDRELSVAPSRQMTQLVEDLMPM
ncbi:MULTISPECIES: BTAD domain-containing putative transcriptional regulator [unclassified Streptomyces]|uniref:AfsR/SARP family transcriptional regulator n=1 Tax=unclassified Streptomyces TaxID=2593676 RepID=UPI0028858B73|nr:bacterial transcriptional activator domain-containing protein [Streptomyces sp. DSM 41633]